VPELLNRRGRAFVCPEIGLVSSEKIGRWGAPMISTLKVQTLETELIEKIKAAIKKRAEAKAKRMFLKRPKRLTKRG
jgi:hypothetical protein